VFLETKWEKVISSIHRGRMIDTLVPDYELYPMYKECVLDPFLTKHGDWRLNGTYTRFLKTTKMSIERLVQLRKGLMTIINHSIDVPFTIGRELILKEEQKAREDGFHTLADSIRQQREWLTVMRWELRDDMVSLCDKIKNKITYLRKKENKIQSGDTMEECGVCMEDKIPKILKCGHHLCDGCVKEVKRT